MSQTFDVNYNLNVRAQTGIDAINRFKNAVGSLTKVTQNLSDVERRIRGVSQTMTSLTKTTNQIRINVKPATQSLGKLIRGIQKARSELTQLQTQAAKGANVKTNVSQARNRATRGVTPPPATSSRPAPAARPTPMTRSGIPMVRNTNALGYKLFGPTPLPNNGGMAIDMLKGMGIAYGIAGLGQLMSNVVTQATEYDNTMKTVENILKSHDDKGGFSTRFSAMSNVIRQVGMETKYKVTEVADAAKFLAMAGLDVESIQRSIRPIADIALVGDTELGETADLVTNIMTAYNIVPERMRNAADVMTNTFTMSNTTLTEIAEAYKYSASLLSAGGISFEEATAAIGVLGDAGIKSSQAGTTMRTIMGNIINPRGKKRIAAWDATGIARTDANGNARSLLDIFQDLAAKGYSVDVFYKLFDKTAAQGAVALAQHVDKWNNVFTENFLSGGISNRLAEEKKNTIQGLWAQLTSVFTDQGVTAFGGVEGQIRDLLLKAIEWMKSDEAAEVIQNMSHTLMEFVHVLLDVSKYFYSFFKFAEPFIKTWMKFQLYIWPVVKTITAFRSVMLGLIGLRRVGLVISGLATNFATLGTSIAATGAATKGAAFASIAGGRVMTPYGFAAGATWLPMLSEKGYANAAKGLHLQQPLFIKDGMSPRIKQHLQKKWADYNQYHARDQKRFQRRVIGRQMLNGAGTLIGGAAVGVGASMMMDEENGTSGKVAGGLLGAAGMAAMVGGPVGWAVAGVLALGAGVAYVAEQFDKASKAAERMSERFAKFKVVEGQIVSDNSSDITKYLANIHQQNVNIDEVLQLRIKHTRELLGLENQPTSNPSAATTDTFLRGFEDAFAGYGDAATTKYLQEMNPFLAILGASASLGGSQGYTFGIGEDVVTNLSKQAWAGQMAIAEEVATGKYTQQLFEDFGKQQAAAVLNNDEEGLKKLAANFESQWGAETWNPIDWHRNWTADQWRKFAEDPSKFGQDGVYQRLVYNRFVGDYGGSNGAIGAMNAFHDALRANSSDLTDKFIALYKYAGPNGLLMENYGTDAWWAKNGWDGHTFVGVGENLNGLEQAQVILKQIEDFQVILRRLGADNTDNEGVKAMLADIETLRKNAEGYLAITQGKPLPEGWEIPDGFKVPLNGRKYEYDAQSKQWFEIMNDEDAQNLQNSFHNTWGFGSNMFGRNSFMTGQNYGLIGSYNFEQGWNTTFMPFATNGALVQDSISNGLNYSLSVAAPTTDWLTYNWGVTSGANGAMNYDFGFNSTFTPLATDSALIPDSINGGLNYVLGMGYNGIGNLGWSWGQSYGSLLGWNFNSGLNSAWGASTGFGGGLGLGTGGGFGTGGLSLGSGLGSGTGSMFSLSGSSLYNTNRFGFGNKFGLGNNFSFAPKAGQRNPSIPGISTTQFQTSLGAQKGTASATGTDSGSGGGGNHLGGGSDPSKYRSHYNKGNAAPKQINVTIKNLMSVEKIDLSNPNNVAVIDNLKSQLAQALVDVVGDSDVMLAGLTT